MSPLPRAIRGCRERPRPQAGRSASGCATPFASIAGTGRGRSSICTPRCRSTWTAACAPPSISNPERSNSRVPAPSSPPSHRTGQREMPPYSFARNGAALRMKVEDLRPRGAGWTVHLHEKGGKEHAMPCHHALAEALRAYIVAAGIAGDPRAGCSAPRAGTKPIRCPSSP